jgi:hypothetical protein
MDSINETLVAIPLSRLIQASAGNSEVLIAVLDDIMHWLDRALFTIESKLPDDFAVHIPKTGLMSADVTTYPILEPLWDLSSDLDHMLENLRSGQKNGR